MTLARYLHSRRGLFARLAEHLGVSVPLVSMWASGDRPVPPVQCFAIERWTKGKVRAEAIRPDLSFARWKTKQGRS